MSLEIVLVLSRLKPSTLIGTMNWLFLDMFTGVPTKAVGLALEKCPKHTLLLSSRDARSKWKDLVHMF